MFENAKKICSQKDYGNGSTIYFCDLNIIYPLKRAVLNIIAEGECEVYVGGDKADGFYADNTGYISYDITSLVAESDFLYISVKDNGKEYKNCITAEINLEFSGGLLGKVVSDESWKCTKGTIGTPQICTMDCQLWNMCADSVRVI
ncbi:MAG: hypothetical protein IKI97_05610 [Clostridia bacterium]|nr:hypothetical protein [Clostridia bacterium]